MGTCHSWKPCRLSGFNFLIATTMPVPALHGAKVFSSTLPLKTVPKPPMPSTLSDLKFRVAVFKSAKLKIFKLGVGKICPSGNASSWLSLAGAADSRLFPALLLVIESPPSLLVLSDVPETDCPEKKKKKKQRNKETINKFQITIMQQTEKESWSQIMEITYLKI